MGKLLTGVHRASVSAALRVLTMVVCVIAAPGVFHAFIGAVSALPHLPTWPHLLVGFIAGLAVGRFALRHLPTLCILEHELTHLLAGLCFFCLPTRFVVNGRGGLAGHRSTPFPLIGPFVNDFVTLAPYVVPTFSVILALLAPLWPAAARPTAHLALGVTLGFHLSTTARELVINWTGRVLARADNGAPQASDIAQVGFAFSLVYIPVVALTLHGLVLALAASGYAGITAWGHAAARGMQAVWVPWLARQVGA